jgi:DNA-binding transcriptional MerR regulator
MTIAEVNKKLDLSHDTLRYCEQLVVEKEKTLRRQED